MKLIKRKNGELTPEEQAVISNGFARHTEELGAPPYERERINWLAYEGQACCEGQFGVISSEMEAIATESGEKWRLVGALTADLLWDWLYIDELWVDESRRGQGLGKALMQQVEEYAVSRRLTGLWLWTQSWQAAGFYSGLGYEEFARFENFPKDHARIGFRKQL